MTFMGALCVLKPYEAPLLYSLKPYKDLILMQVWRAYHKTRSLSSYGARNYYETHTFLVEIL